MEHPNTPKTPTASAWLALMDDELDEEGKPMVEAPEVSKTQTADSGNHWVYPFCNIIPSADNCALAMNEEPMPMKRFFPTAIDTEIKLTEVSGDNPKNADNQSFLQRMQAYYDNLQATTFSKITKIEEEISSHIDKVESPCKMMSSNVDGMFDEVESPCKMMSSKVGDVFSEFDEEFIDHMESEGDESTTLYRNESPNIFNELQESIPYLRERNNTFTSSKYKDFIESHATMSDNDSSRKGHSLHSQTQQQLEDNRRAIDSPRKFPVSDSFDQFNNATVPEKMMEKAPEFSSRTMRTAKTETMTKVSDDSPLDAIDPPMSEDIIALPLSTVDTVSSNDILKKISSLTTDGDTFRIDSHDETKMCVPPMLMKKFVSLRNIKIVRSQSSAQSATTSARGALRNGDSAEDLPSESIQIDDLFTESGSKNHAYVAFFRRGLKATRSIRLYQHPIPAVFPIIDGEVVVHVEASTISQTDLQIRRGDFWGEDSQRALNLPIVPGVTFSGIIYQTTPSGLKSGLNVGDRVISLVQVGANSRHLCLKCEQLVKVPEELNDPCSVACIPEIYLTAFQALHMGQKNGARYRRTSLAGKEILILGGASLIGRALIEVAVAAGCGTVYATGKENQFKTIYDAGGAPLGRDPRLWRSLLSNKMDLIIGIDHSVGKSEISEDHVALLSRNGRLILLCNPDRDEPTIRIHEELIDFFKVNGRKLNLYNVFEAWENELKQCKRDLTHLLKLLIDGSIQPRILESIGLNKVARAQDLLSEKSLNGFIICEPWMKGKKKEGLGIGEVYAESASKSTSYESLAILANNTEPCEVEISGI